MIELQKEHVMKKLLSEFNNIDLLMWWGKSNACNINTKIIGTPYYCLKY
jgi:hypothetical protein